MATLLGFDGDVRKKQELIPNRYQQSKVVTNYGNTAVPTAQTNTQTVNKVSTPNTSSAKNSVSSRAAGTLKSLSDFDVVKPISLNTETTTTQTPSISLNTNNTQNTQLKSIQPKQSQGVLEKGPWGQNGPTTSSPVPTLKTLSNTNFDKNINNASKDPLNQTNILNKIGNTNKSSTNSKMDNIWADTEDGKYYNDEFRKSKNSQNIGQRLLDQGSASRIAEQNARARYNQDLIDKAFDDDGNIVDENAYDKLLSSVKEASQISNVYSEAEKAKSRKIGASVDSDFYTGKEAFDNPFTYDFGKQLAASANVIRNMSVFDAITGADDTKKFDGNDIGKFLGDLVPGMLAAPIQGAAGITEAIKGEGTDEDTGKTRQLDDLERLGRGTSGAIDAAGTFFGGSGELVKAAAGIFTKAGKDVVKKAATSVVKDYIKSMLEEGGEEAVQQVFDYFGNGGKLITSDGELDWNSVKDLAGQVAEAGALGAVGGAVFKGAGDALQLGAKGVNIANTKAKNYYNDNIRGKTLGGFVDYGAMFGRDRNGEVNNVPTKDTNYKQLRNNIIKNDVYTADALNNILDGYTNEENPDAVVREISRYNDTDVKLLEKLIDENKVVYDEETGWGVNFRKLTEGERKNLVDMLVSLDEEREPYFRYELRDVLLPEDIDVTNDTLFDKMAYDAEKNDADAKSHLEGYIDDIKQNGDIKTSDSNPIRDTIIEQINKKNDEKSRKFLASRYNMDWSNPDLHNAMATTEIEQKVRTPEEITRDLDRAYADLDAGYGDEAEIKKLETELDEALSLNENPEFNNDVKKQAKSNTKTEIKNDIDNNIVSENKKTKKQTTAETVSDNNTQPPKMNMTSEQITRKVEENQKARDNEQLIAEQINGKSANQNGVDLSEKETIDYVDKMTKQQEQAYKNQKSKKGGEPTIMQRIRDALVDNVDAVLKDVPEDLKPLVNEQIDRVTNSGKMTEQWLIDRGYEKIGKLPKNRKNILSQYAIAKSAEDAANLGKETGRNRQADLDFVKSIESDTTKYADVLDAYDAYRNILKDARQLGVEGGLFSQANADAMEEMHPNYAPLQRIMEDNNSENFGSRAIGSIGSQNYVRTLEGSDLVVADPINSTIDNVGNLIQQVERNKLSNILASNDIYGERVLKNGENPRPGYGKISFLADGVKRDVEVPSIVEKQMKQLGNEHANFLVKVAGIPGRVVRQASTALKPAFAVSNLIRDWQQADIVGGEGHNKQYLSSAKKAFEATFLPTKEGKAIRAEMNRNGIVGSDIEAYRTSLGGEKTSRSINRNWNVNKGEYAKYRLTHPLKALEDLIGRTEYYTRARQYIYAKEMGKTDVEAAQAARNNTLNFSRGGNATKAINRIVPFFNAGVQGGRKLAETAKNRPVHFAKSCLLFGGTAMAMQAINAMTNADLWDKVPDDDKEQNFIYFTPDAHYNEETGRVEGVIKVPVTQMMYPVLSGINQTIKASQGKSGALEGILEFASTTISQLTGVNTDLTGFEEGVDEGLQTQGMETLNQFSTPVKPLAEYLLNKDFYTGKDIVKDKYAEPSKDGIAYGNDNNSGLAVRLSEATGMSASKLNNIINDYGGGLGKEIANSVPNPNVEDGETKNVIEAELNDIKKRFASTGYVSEYNTQADNAKDYKSQVKETEEYKSLSNEDKSKVLKAIDTDTKAIASKQYKERNNIENDDKLSSRQQTLSEGFNASDYVNTVIDGANTKRKIDINDSISNQSKDILNKYSKMTSEEWDAYEKKNDNAEYDYAKAKYENDVANGKLTEAQKINKEAELKKLSVGSTYSSDIRDAYSLAGTKSKMQALLNKMNDETRESTVDELNKLNRDMYNSGVISASTYKTRKNAINNTTSSSSSSGYSRSGSSSNSEIGYYEMQTLNKLAKALAETNPIKVGSNATNSNSIATNRKMKQTELSNGRKQSYGSSPKISVKKGIA